MIVCPACHAENPEGTKICVKCATELPKAMPSKAEKAKAAAAAASKFGIRDVSRDMVDLIWLVLILVMILGAFLFLATNGTFHLTDTEEAQIIEAPVRYAPKAPASHARKPTASQHEVTSSSAIQPPQPGENLLPPQVQTAPEVAEEKPVVLSGSAQTFFDKGKKQYDTQHYQASFNFLKQSLEVDPTFAKAYFGLGYLYSRFDMSDAAVRMYEMALRFDPSHVDSINNLAMMYYHAGNSEDALDLLQRASAMGGQNADIQYNLGSIYLEKNQVNEALQAFQTAAQIRPNDAVIYNNMALTYEKMGKKQEAQDSWQKVMQLSNNSILLQQAKAHLDYLQTQG